MAEMLDSASGPASLQLFGTAEESETSACVSVTTALEQSTFLGSPS